MIEGVLRHCTDMDIQKGYVDSHGQSAVGFAFSYMLGFDLLPRIKAIHKEKLYRPESGKPDDYQNHDVYEILPLVIFHESVAPTLCRISHFPPSML